MGDPVQQLSRGMITSSGASPWYGRAPRYFPVILTRPGFLVRHPRLFLVRERTLAEEQHVAVDRADRLLGFEPHGVAKRHVVEMREPELHRRLALALGLLGRVVELARDSLGIDLAHQQVAPGLRYARPGRRIGADLLQDHVDAALAVVRRRGLVARRIALHADEEHGRQWVERGGALVQRDHLVGPRRPWRLALLAHHAARAVLREPGARLAVDHDRQRTAGRLRALRQVPTPGAIAAFVADGDGLDQPFLEDVALHVVAAVVEAAGEVDAKAGETEIGDGVADLDLAGLLRRRARGCCSRTQGRGRQGPTK